MTFLEPLSFETPVLTKQGLFAPFWQRWLARLAEVLSELDGGGA